MRCLFLAVLTASTLLLAGGSALAGDKPLLKVNHVTVHDPSVFQDKEGTYYVYGSHTAIGKADDLADWTQVNFDYGDGKDLPSYGTLKETFRVPFAWAGCDDADSAGGYAVWAPDLIYNPHYLWEDGGKGAYMLYTCTSSTWRRSCICYLVSKSLDDPFSYRDTIVYSGFTKTGKGDGSDRNTRWDQDCLNLKHLTELGSEHGGIDEVSDKWFTGAGDWDHTYAPNAIDPNVFFDASGERLYLSYGSWSGGIYLLELDPATGEALYPGKDGIDEASGNFIDRYFGVHLLGGDHASGEGPYILYDPDTRYYYLYVTYGGLTAEGGYNMRLFRSENVTGPYLDAAGGSAADNADRPDKYGIKLIGNYAFYNQVGKRAAGHNSALIDQTGARYLVYHQRFDVKPQLEAHEVRVHQEFLNEDRWPLPAVYEYRGEEPSLYSKEEVVGSYEFINHGTATNGDMVPTGILILKEDGSLEGAASGTWSMKDSGQGYDYADLTIDGVTYKGYFFRQHKENTEEEAVMTFSCLGDNNACIWGSAVDESDGDMMVRIVADQLKTALPRATAENISLPTELSGCMISWQSDQPEVISEDGTVTVPDKKAKVRLTATISKGEASCTREYKILVRKG